MPADAGASELGQRAFSTEWEKSLAITPLQVYLVKCSCSDETENKKGNKAHYPLYFVEHNFSNKHVAIPEC